MVGWEEAYTTRTLLRAEQGLTELLTRGLHRGRGILPLAFVKAGLATVSDLGPDQADAVRRLTQQGHAVEVLIGRAGTGKTSTVAALVSVYRAAGWHVVGVAPSARAARELDERACITAHTIPRFRYHCARTPLDARTVVIFDEVGMADTFDLTGVLAVAAAAGAKVVLVGDARQLPEIGPGGGLAAAIDILDHQVCELTVNHRQREPWEVEALDHLRDGDPGKAWSAFVEHGRVTRSDDIEQVHRRAVEDWWLSHRTGLRSVILAGTRAETAALNHRARNRAAAEGALSGPSLVVAGREFQMGDRVLCTRNDDDQRTPDGRQATVDNGTLAVVTRVATPDRALCVEVLGTRRPLRLSPEYLESGAVEHGYAMTVHKAQGATFDQVFVVGPAGLYREAAYVALSRARLGTWLYASTGQLADLESSDHSTGITPDDEADASCALVDRLDRSKAKRLVLRDWPVGLHAAALADLPLNELDQRLRRARSAEHDAQRHGLTEPAVIRDRYERARQTRSHLAPGRQVRALDRDNVATVESLDDGNGTAMVSFTGRHRQAATRVLRWSELQVMDHSDPVTIGPAAQTWLARAVRDLGHAERAWSDALARHDVSPDERASLEWAIDVRSRRLTNQLTASPPPWLTTWLGQRPVDPVGSMSYDDAVARLAAWRDRHHLPPSQAGLGLQPDEPDARASWSAEMSAVTATRTWLTNREHGVTRHERPPRTLAEIEARRRLLDQLLASAPPAQHGADPRDVSHPRLAVQGDRRRERQDWILTNWPFVVERHELDRIDQSLAPNDEDEVVSSVNALLDRLARTVDGPVERRTAPLES